MIGMPTAADVAAWMVRELAKTDWLAHEDAVAGIERHFGAAFLHAGAARREAIHEDVLAEFRKLTADTVVWDRSEHAWRPRDAADDPTRRAAD